jgi:pimeloyl-ACP methyl ester carboxylesterase
LAADAGMRALDLPDSRLVGFSGGATPARRLVVFIESDGAPWPWPDTPPADPTPVAVTVIRMAVIEAGATAGAVAVGYLGRPCQFQSATALAACDPGWWTLGRFHPAPVAMTSAAIDRAKTRHAAQRVDLVGYSGGGAMALLVAAGRSDVTCVVTLAAPLDTAAWTAALGVTPLRNSLNPAHADLPPGLRQTHFRGLRDTVVPPATAAGFLARARVANVVDVAEYGHDCCWARDWAELRKRSCLAS